MSEIINTPKRMLYKHPGRHEIHNDHFDYTIVDDTEESIENALNHGWHLTTPEALANSGNDKPKEKAPTQTTDW